MQLPDKKLKIKTNREWLKKALLNVIHNAIKYNKENGSLIIKVEILKRGYLLIIRDTGIGIKEKEKIFSKYYTKDNIYGTGIGLNFAKIVIESFGGKIYFESEENVGTIFYIYLPKVSKKIKLKILASAFAAVLIIAFFVIDYFYCLIPQKIKIEVTDNLKIIKFESGIIARANRNDELKIIAYKNIFNTRTRNEIIAKKSDIEVATNGNKIKIITPNTTFTNLGTQFETIAKNKTAVSVFNGEIKSKNIVVAKNEGLIVAKTIQKLPLPKKVSDIKIQTEPKLTISWKSPYKEFKILISKDKNFSNPPIYSYLISKNQISPSLPDGEWYINIKARHNELYSLPTIKKFISLNNYYKALSYYKQHKIKQALFYINKSINTINDTSSKPYYLYGKILTELKNYKKALYYLKKGERIGGSDNLLKAKIFFANHKYKEVINILKPPKNTQEKLLLAKAYYKLKNYKLANKYLYQILEKDPNNKEALRLLSLPTELKKGIINGTH